MASTGPRASCARGFSAHGVRTLRGRSVLTHLRARHRRRPRACGRGCTAGAAPAADADTGHGAHKGRLALDDALLAAAVEAAARGGQCAAGPRVQAAAAHVEGLKEVLTTMAIIFVPPGEPVCIGDVWVGNPCASWYYLLQPGGPGEPVCCGAIGHGAGRAKIAMHIVLTTLMRMICGIVA